MRRHNEAFALALAPLLLLDLDPAAGLERIRARGDVANAFETTDTLERCRAVFLAIEARGKRVIDATQPEPAVLESALREVLGAAACKIADAHGLTKEGVNAVLAVGGGSPIPV